MTPVFVTLRISKKLGSNLGSNLGSGVLREDIKPPPRTYIKTDKMIQKIALRIRGISAGQSVKGTLTNFSPQDPRPQVLTPTSDPNFSHPPYTTPQPPNHPHPTPNQGPHT